MRTETHISWVIATGDLAFKIHKPVATDVLDRTTVERRREACAEEVRVNARLAPDVYLGVGAIVLDGRELEPVIVMRRMPDDRRLTGLLGTPEAPEAVRAVARAVAAFHSRAEVLDPERARRVSSTAALAHRWADDLRGIEAVGGPWVAARASELRRLSSDYLEGRDALLEQRIADGMVRDGHGDLQAEDIFLLPDGPRILDSLAFDERLRHNDVIADIAFLVMDVQRLGHPELALALLRHYCDLSGEHHPGSLAHLYVAQRALVRAKVTALRTDLGPAGAAQVDVLLDLAADHLRRAEITVALVGGPPGAGKSTIAARLGEELGWAVVSSDEVRRDLAARGADMGPWAYDPRVVAAVYAEVRHRARQLAGHGVSVVLDASWTSAAERDAARAMAAAVRARLVEVRCDAPADVCRRRVADRRDPHASEATPHTVDLLGDRTDPWPEAIGFDTSPAAPDVAGLAARIAPVRAAADEVAAEL